MRVLLLASAESPLKSFLEKNGEIVLQTAERLSFEILQEMRPEFIISYGYRYIVTPEILELFPLKAINLHISLLPWNRGADPNFWSFIDDSPKGVTIHYMSKGLDTGDIIVQKEVEFSSDETLKSSYEKLHREIQELFYAHWESIKSGVCGRTSQTGRGSYHRTKDKDTLTHLLTHGWDTPVAHLKNFKKPNLEDKL